MASPRDNKDAVTQTSIRLSPELLQKGRPKQRPRSDRHKQNCSPSLQIGPAQIFRRGRQVDETWLFYLQKLDLDSTSRSIHQLQDVGCRQRKHDTPLSGLMLNQTLRTFGSGGSASSGRQANLAT